MKKLLAILLALALVLVNVAALADGIPEVPVNEDQIEDMIETALANKATDPTFVKKYTVTGAASGTTVYPAETLTFSVTPKDTTYPTVTVGTNNKYVVDGKSAEYTIAVNVPAASAYAKPGKYHYDVKETGAETASQGVTYNTTTNFSVDVWVYYEGTTLTRVVNVYSGAEVTGEATTKDDKLENQYKVGKLTVTKQISGNLADPTKVFTINVLLESTNKVTSDIKLTPDTGVTVTSEGTWSDANTRTITFTAVGGKGLTIENIPEGVTYTVTELTGTDTGAVHEITGATGNTQIDKVNDLDAYAITYTTATGAISSSEAKTATVTNTKEITVPNGISVDFVPYVMIIALAGIALVALKARKKEN